MRCCRRREPAVPELPQPAAVPLVGGPGAVAAGAVIGAPAAAAAAAPAAEIAAAPTRVAERVTEEDLRRATRAGEAARARLAGARALPWASTVSRRGTKVVFVVCRGSLAAGRPRAVFYGDWEAVREAVCTAAGNLDSGSIFHGFRSALEARAYWVAAVGDEPWPVGVPRQAAGR
jgi:hypothetical protein